MPIYQPEKMGQNGMKNMDLDTMVYIEVLMRVGLIPFTQISTKLSSLELIDDENQWMEIIKRRFGIIS